MIDEEEKDIDEEEKDIDEEEKDIWCNDCGIRMFPAGRRMDIISGKMKPQAKCPMCRKWEFVKNG